MVLVSTQKSQGRRGFTNYFRGVPDIRQIGDPAPEYPANRISGTPLNYFMKSAQETLTKCP